MTGTKASGDDEHRHGDEGVVTLVANMGTTDDEDGDEGG